MTVAVALRVHDGLVLAADSASTLVGTDPSTGNSGVFNVYNNACKIVNLYKGLPVGMMTWGAGSIGPASIATLAKDLRARLMVEGDGGIEPGAYDMLDVANRVRQFFYEERYVPEFGHLPPEQQPDLGLCVAGYSPGQQLAEVYQVDICGGQCPEPALVGPPEVAGVTVNGQPEAVARLLRGYSLGLPAAMQSLGVQEPELSNVLAYLQTTLSVPMVEAAMPIQDAIDLAEFLVYVTIQYSRFKLDWPTCGGPIEVAAITKHEGFRWVKRKMYFTHEFNPEVA